MPSDGKKTADDDANAAQERRRQLEDYLRKKGDKKKNPGKVARPAENTLPNSNPGQARTIRPEADKATSPHTYTIPVKGGQGSTVPQTPATPATVQSTAGNLVSSKLSENVVSFQTSKSIEDPFLSKTPSAARPSKESVLRQYNCLVLTARNRPWQHNTVLVLPSGAEIRVNPPTLRLFTLKHVLAYSRQPEHRTDLVQAMLEVIAAPGQPSCVDPRRKIDYWLLMAGCREKTGDHEGALKALNEAIAWDCTPAARIHEAMDRIGKRKLLAVAASTPVKRYPDAEAPVQALPKPRCDPLSSPLHEEEAREFDEVANKYNALGEPEEREAPRPSTPKPNRVIIENAAKVIQSARAVKAVHQPGKTTTPRKETNSVDRGTRLILTPIRASKRIKTEYGAELMLTPVRKSLRLNGRLEDMSARSVTDMVTSGQAVYIPDPNQVALTPKKKTPDDPEME